MPGLREDLFTNILDWNCNNYLAVSLKQTVYIWSAEKGTCRRIRVNFSEYERAFLTSLSWNESGKLLSVGTNGGEVLLLDAERTKLLISFRSSEKSHISALAWNDEAFCSGSVAGNICLHDERQPTEHVTYIGRHRSMFSLKFSLHNYLASGGSDGVVNIWDIRKLAKCNKIEAHGITKALTWCPWRSNVIATGGYDEDGSIKIWHASTAKLLSQTKINSKVCSMIWSPEYKELVTGLAGPNMKNQIAIWKDESLDNLDLVGALCQHDGQPLHLALSPTGTILASAGSDEIMCLWNCFPSTRKGSEDDIFSPLSLLKTVR
ncbi:CDC20 [Acanthosepion pharaonis]|uniref:CDC20 n=1 Tax=Acanthosepion pharaonis TaxID=158019 RepID=A0A812AYC3_ACAPH|nr:CDC20 [Sepia pharaonis]